MPQDNSKYDEIKRKLSEFKKLEMKNLQKCPGLHLCATNLIWLDRYEISTSVGKQGIKRDMQYKLIIYIKL